MWQCRCMLGVGVRLCALSFTPYCRGQVSVALGQPIYLRGSRPQRAAAARPPHLSSSMCCKNLFHLTSSSASGDVLADYSHRGPPAANSASINPAASCTRPFPLGCATPSCPSRAATPAEAYAAEPSRASLAGPNAPSTTPCRSVVVLHGRPTDGGGRVASRNI